MPNFAQAEIRSPTEDLGEYKAFLRTLKVGQTVTLPLEPGESSRVVMRGINSVAAEAKMRINRLPSDEGTVRFRVMEAEKRAVNVTPQQLRARTEKARATREARKAQAQARPAGETPTPDELAETGHPIRPATDSPLGPVNV
jgi:hypothetical protein